LNIIGLDRMEQFLEEIVLESIQVMQEKAGNV
jgi:hypothetical protein